jgi:hypothetical protein
MSIILESQEAEIRKMEVWSQPEQILVYKTLSWKKNSSQERAGGVAQAVRAST